MKSKDDLEDAMDELEKLESHHDPVRNIAGSVLAWVLSEHDNEGAGHLLWELGLRPKPES